MLFILRIVRVARRYLFSTEKVFFGYLKSFKFKLEVIMIPNTVYESFVCEHKHANFHLDFLFQKLPQKVLMFVRKMAQLRHSKVDFHANTNHANSCRIKKNFLAKYLEIISHETFIQINRFAPSKLKVNWNKQKTSRKKVV